MGLDPRLFTVRCKERGTTGASHPMRPFVGTALMASARVRCAKTGRSSGRQLRQLRRLVGMEVLQSNDPAGVVLRPQQVLQALD